MSKHFSEIELVYHYKECREHNSSCTGGETSITEAIELFVDRNSCIPVEKGNFLSQLIYGWDFQGSTYPTKGTKPGEYTICEMNNDGCNKQDNPHWNPMLEPFSMTLWQNPLLLSPTSSIFNTSGHYCQSFDHNLKMNQNMPVMDANGAWEDGWNCTEKN